MAREIVVSVPLGRRETITLLLQAAEALQHQVVRFDTDQGSAELRVDFSLRAMATFRVHAEAREVASGETTLRLLLRPASRLSPWTGFGQSERIGWRLIGKMQEIMDPSRYRQLEDDVLPSRRPASRATLDQR